jgi:hypothetical protein
MNKYWIGVIVMIFFMLNFSQPALTQDKDKRISFSLGGAIEFGGDQVATVYFTNGEDQSVNAGQGGLLLSALDFPLSNKFSIRTLVGFKFVTTAANNANITLTRFPLQVSGVLNLDEKWWVSAGLATQAGINFKGDWVLNSFKLSTKGGPTIGLGYKQFYLSYTAMKYTDDQKYEYNASSFGLGFLIPLKKRVLTTVERAGN